MLSARLDDDNDDCELIFDENLLYFRVNMSLPLL